MDQPLSVRVLRGTPRNLALLARALRRGELVAVPTETVYGLAADARSPAACRKIFRAKGRPSTDPLIVHLHSAQDLAGLCRPNESSRRLAEAFWPGPLTLVLPKTKAVPDVVTAGRDSVAIRVPAHPLFRRLLKLAGIPLAAPSANPFGYISPTTAAHVAHGLGRKIRYVLDGGPTLIGVESTIVDLRDERHPRLLRPGAITREALEAVLRRKVTGWHRHRTKASLQAQIAPGMLTRHYSPKTPVRLHRHLKAHSASKAIEEAFVFQRRPRATGSKNVFWFDERGAPKDVARRLFAVLRQLDHGGFRRIHVELAPGRGLADAINDRLRRAAAG